MRKFLTISVIFLLGLCLVELNAQNSVVTAGGDATGSNGIISYSFGQTVYATYTGETGSVAQGVQQPFEISEVSDTTVSDTIVRETYYVSSNGDDGNSGTSESLAWQTLAKVNSVTFEPGDHVLFQCGDTLFGELVVDGQGNADSLITFSSYGSGPMPVISGLTNVTSWELYDGNIYRAPLTYSGDLNLVLIDGEQVGMGRYPNDEYLYFESHSGQTSITDNELTDDPNWAGAEVVIRTNHWVLDRCAITAHSGGTLTFSTCSYEPRDTFGYFIQSDLRTLDQLGEWFFENDSLYMHFNGESPDSFKVEAGVVDTLAYVRYSRDYMKFEGIEFRGASVTILY